MPAGAIRLPRSAWPCSLVPTDSYAHSQPKAVIADGGLCGASFPRQIPMLPAQQCLLPAIIALPFKDGATAITSPETDASCRSD